MDLTDEYYETNRWLNGLVGLDQCISVQRADVTNLPFPDATFDVAISQHVQMNIADKARLCSEARRVLVNGGRLGLWDIAIGESGRALDYPLPWADEPARSYLVTPGQLHHLIESNGFAIEQWNDLTDQAAPFMQSLLTLPPNPLGLHAFVNDFERKAENLHCARGRTFAGHPGQSRGQPAHGNDHWRHTAGHGGVVSPEYCPEQESPESEDRVLGLPEKVRACLFDLDGVLTDTASVHTKAWKATFDAYLSQRAERTGEKFVPFDAAADYRKYVDGKKREDGVRSFLQSRGIELPEGGPDDPGDAETIHGLGNRKNDMFQKVLERDGVEVFDGSRRYLEAVSTAGLGIAVVSASANTPEVLKITGLDRFIQQRVDGNTLREEHLPGKPAPDSFLRGAQLLDVAPDAAAVFEDALSGVAAGHAGHFGYVVGVDRVGQAEDLRKNGADVVVTDLAELLQS